MAKKGGKKNKKGSKPVAAAVVDNVKDVIEPDHETVDETNQTEGQTEAVEQTEAPEAATQPTETVAEPSKALEPTPATEAPATEIPAVAETKEVETEEAVKAEEALATENKGTVEEAVEKAQASKAGQLGELEGGAAAGTAILPETTTKEPVPSIATTGVSETLAERPKTAESTDVPAVVAPVPIAAPVETDAAHPKRPYENPIFNNEENLKPHKMPKTDEEAIGASVAEDKKTIETLAGAGPASTAAFTTPEPVPVQAEEPKAFETPVVAEAPKAVEEKVVETPVVAETPNIVEEKVAETPVVAEAPKAVEEKVEAPKAVETPKVAEEKVAEAPVVAEAPKVAQEKKVAETPVVAEAPKAVEEKIPVESVPKSTPAQTGAGKSTSSPVAIAAANAAILSSKGDKAAPPAAATVVAKEAEPKKPEAALKRGEEPLPKAEAPKAEPVKEEAAKAQPETQKTSEPLAEQAEKKKGGFMSWLKRKFK
ncbi:hypothetical protein N7536_003776 [Penicillium majusculum]|uniref:Uncharacterized protein n=1 Tax=Penicillium solitum TaxID=60172 RepID=A0A1V6RKU2_9EURO|nr:uncharacterized protein PENSOL_c003G03306 [Penicillium solitum]KAJ5700763.1 hypothetical protein N7536_003776 [Penicillium majusculum]OQE02074.1 hypothetical protein PENSOL_c003G03306 [Penicillium solitum]